MGAMRGLPTRLLLPLVAVLALACTGCVEAEETLEIDADGGGRYRLVLRWNADLWRRVGDAVGDRARRALATPSVPMKASAWRDALEPIPGIEIVQLEEQVEDGGWKRLDVELRFQRLKDLWRFEFLGRRKLTVGLAPGTTEGGTRKARIEMGLMKRFPVLDPVAALVRAERKRTARAPEGVRGDPDLMKRLGLSRERIQLVWDLAGPAIEEARLTFRLAVPRGVQERLEGASEQRADSTTWTIGFGDLQSEEAPRSLWMTWQPRGTDTIPKFVHPKPKKARAAASGEGAKEGDKGAAGGG